MVSRVVRCGQPEGCALTGCMSMSAEEEEWVSRESGLARAADFQLHKRAGGLQRHFAHNHRRVAQPSILCAEQAP